MQRWVDGCTDESAERTRRLGEMRMDFLSLFFLKADFVKCIALNPIPLKGVVKKLNFRAFKLLSCGSGMQRLCL